MARFPINVKGLNVLLIVLALFVLAGSAFAMSKPTSFRSGASNVTQILTGKLVKNGTPEFSNCAASLPYGLLGTGVATCLPLQANSAQAGPLVGKKVMVTGTLRGGVFYASNIKSR